MLIAASKEVRETVKRNYEAGLSVLPAEETVESIQTNPRTVENMDIDYFVGLLNAEWGVTENRQKNAEHTGRAGSVTKSANDIVESLPVHINKRVKVLRTVSSIWKTVTSTNLPVTKHQTKTCERQHIR